MDHANPMGEGPGASVGPAQPISISIIYGDSKSRDEAAMLCGRLTRNLRPEFRFRLKWLPFELLRDAKAARTAAVATARADLVIVATLAGRALPRRVKTWMAASLSRRKKPDGALVALMRMAKDLQQGKTPVHSFLAALARQARMDYMPEIIYPAPAR